MKNFDQWPLDGQIGFVSIILALSCVIGADFFDRREHFIVKKMDDYFRMSPLRSCAIRGLGFLLLCGITTYGVSQSGHCPTMTVIENAHNRFIGIMLACAFWIMCAWYFYSIYLIDYTFLWSGLDEIGIKMGYTYFSISGKKFHLPFGRSGRKQLMTLITSKILRFDSPLIPIYDKTITEALIGKSILVNIFRIDETCQCVLLRSSIGKIMTANQKIISVKFEDGETFQASGNIRGFSSSGIRPEYVAVWYT